MIKDRKNGDYFNSIEEFKTWLNVLPDVESKCALLLDGCVTEQDFVDFANEYELQLNDGTMVHEYEVV